MRPILHFHIFSTNFRCFLLQYPSFYSASFVITFPDIANIVWTLCHMYLALQTALCVHFSSFCPLPPHFFVSCFDFFLWFWFFYLILIILIFSNIFTMHLYYLFSCYPSLLLCPIFPCIFLWLGTVTFSVRRRWWT